MSSQRIFTISNPSFVPVTVAAAEIVPAVPEFSASPSQALPVVLGHDETLDVTVTASSSTEGLVTSNLEITHSGSNSPLVAPLSANFVTPPPVYGPGSMMKARSGGVWGRLNKIASYTFTDFTHQYWVKLLSSPAPQQFGQYYGHTFAGNVNNYRLTDGTLVFSATAMGLVSDPGADSVLDSWLHWTYRRIGTTATIFLNGIPIKVEEGVPSTSFDYFGTDHDLYFGQVTIPTTEPQLAFRMSDFRMFNIGRSDAEILAEFQQRLVGNEAGLVCYYPMYETDSVFVDFTGLNAAIFLKNLTGTGPDADIGWNADSPPPFV